MKKTVFTLGLIAGILGILSCSTLLFKGLNMPVTNQDAKSVIIVSLMVLIFQIIALVSSLMIEKNTKVLGIVIIICSITNIPASLYSLSADSPITFISSGIVGILFLIAGVIGLAIKDTAKS